MPTVNSFTPLNWDTKNDYELWEAPEDSGDAIPLEELLQDWVLKGEEWVYPFVRFLDMVSLTTIDNRQVDQPNAPTVNGNEKARETYVSHLRVLHSFQTLISLVARR